MLLIDGGTSRSLTLGAGRAQHGDGLRIRVHANAHSRHARGPRFLRERLSTGFASQPMRVRLGTDPRSHLHSQLISLFVAQEDESMRSFAKWLGLVCGSL